MKSHKTRQFWNFGLGDIENDLYTSEASKSDHIFEISGFHWSKRAIDLENFHFSNLLAVSKAVDHIRIVELKS